MRKEARVRRHVGEELAQVRAAVKRSVRHLFDLAAVTFGAEGREREGAAFVADDVAVILDAELLGAQQLRGRLRRRRGRRRRQAAAIESHLRRRSTR